MIRETCAAIWNALREVYLKTPESKEEWLNIAEGFQKEWNFPCCLGALDGKHIAIE